MLNLEKYKMFCQKGKKHENIMWKPMCAFAAADINI